MHWKLQCLQLALVNRKGPVLCDNVWLYITQPVLQKLNGLVYEVLPHLPYSLNLPPTDYRFFKHLDNFLQGKCFHNQPDAENAFQEFIEFRSMDFFFFFCYGNKQIFLIGKNVLVVMVPILITKDVFEPSYNELKFRIRNCYYFCINLISWLWATMLYA